MDESAFQKHFSVLMDRISTLPQRERAMLVGLSDMAAADEQEISKCVNALDQSIDYIRLCLNYLVFDLEATRRENTCLRNLLTEADHEQEPPHEDRESFWDDSAD
jgi:hypothetical protein